MGSKQKSYEQVRGSLLREHFSVHFWRSLNSTEIFCHVVDVTKLNWTIRITRIIWETFNISISLNTSEWSPRPLYVWFIIRNKLCTVACTRFYFPLACVEMYLKTTRLVVTWNICTRDAFFNVFSNTVLVNLLIVMARDGPTFPKPHTRMIRVNVCKQIFIINTTNSYNAFGT